MKIVFLRHRRPWLHTTTVELVQPKWLKIKNSTLSWSYHLEKWNITSIYFIVLPEPLVDYRMSCGIYHKRVKPHRRLLLFLPVFSSTVWTRWSQRIRQPMYDRGFLVTWPCGQLSSLIRNNNSSMYKSNPTSTTQNANYLFYTSPHQTILASPTASVS